MSTSVRDEHEVTFNVDIVVGVNPATAPLHWYDTIRDGQRKRIYDATPPDHTFHLEYNLVPSGLSQHEGARYKTDVVTFGMVCKVHTDKDSRVIKAWEEDGLLHYAWRHRHKLKVDQALLHTLFDHTLEVRVWNTKGKLSPRARFDRPKAFRLPVSDPDQPQSWDLRPDRFPLVFHDQPRQSRVNPTRSRCSFLGSSSSTVDSIQRAGSSQMTFGTGPGQPVPVLGMGSSLVPPALAEEEEMAGTGSTSRAVTPHRGEETTAITGFTAVSPYAMQALHKPTTTKASEEQAEEVRVEREGLAVLPLPLASLYGHASTITSELGQGTRDLRAMRVTLEVEGDLMSPSQRRSLNPLCITVCQARGIPQPPPTHGGGGGATPLVTPEASLEPIYVQYQLLGTTYRTSGKQWAGPTVTWNETKVTLLGTRERAQVMEYLRGPPLTIEVHDRDRKATPPPARSVFGQERDDNVIGTQEYCKDKRAASSRYPHGVARLDLSELLLGQRLIEVRLQVLNCPNAGQEGDVPRGDYLSSHTDIKIRLRSPGDGCCSFGRLVYVITCENGGTFVRSLLDRVNDTNARALGLSGLSPDLLNAALSTCKLTSDQIARPDCDVITGFQACDGECHVVVLEGPARSSLRDLWDGLEHLTSQASDIVRVLYNSEYTFSSRLYGTLDVDITTILVPQPLGRLAERASLYYDPAKGGGWRGDAAEASTIGTVLLRLHDLRGSREMAEVVRNSLLPSAEEVTSLSVHYSADPHRTHQRHHCCQGQHQPTGNEGGVVALVDVTTDRPTTPRPGDKSQERLHREPLELTNPRYEVLLAERKGAMATDFIRRNITHCQMLSPRDGKRDGRRRSLSEETSHSDEPAFNYSTQTLNSTERSKARLRAWLSRDLQHRYTYSRDYQGATVAPFDTKEVLVAERLLSKGLWLTAEGFVYPGVTASLASNAHPGAPGDARVEELREPFQDCWLHSALHKTTAETRRIRPFELYKRPPAHLGVAPPTTIHLAGVRREAEVREAVREEEEVWRSKVVVDDLAFHVHRKPVAMEMKGSGPGASSQLDRVLGLLKDPPTRPALPCVEPCGVLVPRPLSEGTDRGSRGGYHPGDLGRSLKMDRNVVPIRIDRSLQGHAHLTKKPHDHKTPAELVTV